MANRPPSRAPWVKHGMHGSPTQNTWKHMLSRCLNPSHPAYKHYGARGITVCDRWLRFVNFFEDMGVKPSGRGIERKDNNKGYEPSNCVWASQADQVRNTRHNIVVEYDGRRMVLKDWADERGLINSTVYWRVRNGWSIERALGLTGAIRIGQ